MASTTSCPPTRERRNTQEDLYASGFIYTKRNEEEINQNKKLRRASSKLLPLHTLIPRKYNQEHVDFLKKTPLFRKIPTKYITALLEHSVLETFNNIVFKKGDRASTVFCVFKGKIDLFLDEPEDGNYSESKSFYQCQPGSILGELAIYPNRTRTTTAYAFEQAMMFVIEAEQLVNICKIVPKMMLNCVLIIQKKLLDTNNVNPGLSERSSESPRDIIATPRQLQLSYQERLDLPRNTLNISILPPSLLVFTNKEKCDLAWQLHTYLQTDKPKGCEKKSYDERELFSAILSALFYNVITSPYLDCLEPEQLVSFYHIAVQNDSLKEFAKVLFYQCLLNKEQLENNNLYDIFEKSYIYFQLKTKIKKNEKHSWLILKEKVNEFHSKAISFRKYSLFSALNIAEVMELMFEHKDAISLVKYDQGERIIKEGDTGTDMFIIIKGKVKIIKGKGDEEKILGRKYAGEFFGEIALTDDVKRTASVYVESLILEALKVGRESFDKFVKKSFNHMYNLGAKYLPEIESFNDIARENNIKVTPSFIRQCSSTDNNIKTVSFHIEEEPQEEGKIPPIPLLPLEDLESARLVDRSSSSSSIESDAFLSHREDSQEKKQIQSLIADFKALPEFQVYEDLDRLYEFKMVWKPGEYKEIDINHLVRTMAPMSKLPHGITVNSKTLYKESFNDPIMCDPAALKQFIIHIETKNHPGNKNRKIKSSKSKIEEVKQIRVINFLINLFQMMHEREPEFENFISRYMEGINGEKKDNYRKEFLEKFIDILFKDKEAAERKRIVNKLLLPFEKIDEKFLKTLLKNDSTIEVANFITKFNMSFENIYAQRRYKERYDFIYKIVEAIYQNGPFTENAQALAREETKAILVAYEILEKGIKVSSDEDLVRIAEEVQNRDYPSIKFGHQYLPKLKSLVKIVPSNEEINSLLTKVIMHSANRTTSNPPPKITAKLETIPVTCVDILRMATISACGPLEELFRKECFPELFKNIENIYATNITGFTIDISFTSGSDGKVYFTVTHTKLIAIYPIETKKTVPEALCTIIPVKYSLHSEIGNMASQFGEVSIASNPGIIFGSDKKLNSIVKEKLMEGLKRLTQRMEDYYKSELENQQQCEENKKAEEQVRLQEQKLFQQIIRADLELNQKIEYVKWMALPALSQKQKDTLIQLIKDDSLVRLIQSRPTAEEGTTETPISEILVRLVNGSERT